MFKLFLDVLESDRMLYNFGIIGIETFGGLPQEIERKRSTPSLEVKS